MNQTILSVENLRTYYKTRFGEKIFAVDGVSFDIEEGTKGPTAVNVLKG